MIAKKEAKSCPKGSNPLFQNKNQGVRHEGTAIFLFESSSLKKRKSYRLSIVIGRFRKANTEVLCQKDIYLPYSSYASTITV